LKTVALYIVHDIHLHTPSYTLSKNLVSFELFELLHAEMDFTGKVVIITGASSGIGKGAAEYLSTLGAKLVLTGRNEANLKETAKNCAGESILVLGDVNEEGHRRQIIDEAIKKFGKIDVLVNNSGRGLAGDIEATKMDDYDLIMNTNVRSVFHLTQLAVPHLVKSEGNIVNISSVAGLRAFPNATVYCMSKAAIDHFTRALALDLAPKKVRVNAVNPAVIITNFHRQVGMDETAYQAYLERCKETHPLGRVGTTDETAHAIAFLASDLATFITGSCLAVDGGKTVMCPR
jgi:NAD(P)-dependent dehydrogenase (short-subunit alcohol dehydrogenase family)